MGGNHQPWTDLECTSEGRLLNEHERNGSAGCQQGAKGTVAQWRYPLMIRLVPFFWGGSDDFFGVPLVINQFLMYFPMIFPKKSHSGIGVPWKAPNMSVE